MFRQLSLLVLASVVSFGQARESRAVDADVRDSLLSENAGNAKGTLSTDVTGVSVALGPGDLLEIRVFDTPELTQHVRVGSDGKVRLALIGEIPVQGASPDTVQSEITRKLIEGHFVKDPQVSVFVTEYAGQVAYVTGEIARPGAYPLLRSHRLKDLISAGGGFTARAGNRVSIERGSAPARTITADLNSKDEDQSNPEIVPGDNITVSQSGVVYVLGDVERAGGFVLDRRSSLSVMQVLALAEGTRPSASLTKASLIRIVEGNRQDIPLNLKRILKSQSPDLQLQPGDILFVPGSVTRGLGRRSIETILSTASGVAIYRSYR